MEIYSDSQSEKELPEDYFNITEVARDEELFIKTLKNVLNKPTNLESEDDLKEKKIYLIQANKLKKSEEKEDIIISNDNYGIKDKIKGEFQLFNQLSQEYNYNQLYSEDLIFKVINKEPPSSDADKKNHKRKKMADKMRKRIKSDWCSKILNNLNERLKPLNLSFCRLSQCEITNVAKEENNKILKMTLKEFILYRPFDIYKQKEGKKEKVIENWKKNKELLEFLENNKDICIKFNLDNILNTSMKDIYNEYLISDEFQKSIEELKDEGNYYEYIKKYMNTAKNLVDYYSL